MGNFKILPHPQEWEINGNSNLNPEDLRFFFNAESLPLPPGSNFLGDIAATDDQNQAQLHYTLDPQLDLKAEGYLLDIENEKGSLFWEEDSSR